MNNTISIEKQSPISLMRGPNRISNHIELIKMKIRIGEKYGFIHGCQYSQELVENNLILVDKMARGIISCGNAIEKCLANCKKEGQEFTVKDIYSDLFEVFKVGVLEYHITDQCDLACPHCFYGSGPKGSQSTIPIEEFEKLKYIEPKAMVITGGGEPTIYKYNGVDFAGAVAEIRKVLPNVQLGIQTNGTIFPKGDWTDNFLYQRSSLDTDNPETFKILKGVQLFDRVYNKLVHFAQTKIPFVGVGFLFEQKNVEEIPSFICKIFDLLKSKAPECIEKFTIQFRPLGPDIKILKEVRSGTIPYSEGVTKAQIDTVKSQIDEIRSNSPELADFIDLNTNVEVVWNGNSGHPLIDFDYCYVALAYRMVRAGGNNFPCFILVQHEEFCLGNFFGKDPQNDPEAYIKIALATFRFFNKRTEYCEPLFFRQSGINHAAELCLKGEIHLPQGEESRVYFF